MSRHRVSPSAGYCAPSKLPKGPNGRNLCRQCGVEVKPPRLTFCSDECVDAWKVKTSPAHVRHKLLERDRGVCALCELDCLATEKRLRDLRKECFRAYHARLSPSSTYPNAGEWMAVAYVPWSQSSPVEFKPFLVACIEIGLPKPWDGNSLWEADHTTPVSEGGGECGLEGFRTLCRRCHRAETKALAGRRAERRRQDRASMRGREPSGPPKGDDT